VQLHDLLVCFAVAGLTGAAAQVQQRDGAWTLENRALRVTITPAAGQLTVLDKAANYEWRQAADPGAATTFRNVRALAGPERGVSFDADFQAAGGGAHLVQVKLALDGATADLIAEADMPDRSAKIDGLNFLDPFLLDTPSAALAIADYSNGHLYPLDLQPFPKRRFSLDNIDMPWLGVCDIDRGFGYALIVATPDDALFEMQPVERNGRRTVAPRVLWSASKREFRYPRRLIFHFAARGGYVALAKRYRAYAKQLGVVVPFSEKLKKNPNIARLFGAPDLWGDPSLKFANEAKQAGVEKMIQHTSPSEGVRRGVTPEDMKAINALGYLSTTYDVYADILPVEPGKDVTPHYDRVPETVVLRADGQRMTAWLTADKKQYMKRCPLLWTDAAKLVIPKDLAIFPYLGRFIDVITAESLYECYDEQHPLTRTQKREANVAMLSYVRSLGLVTGSEHGRWWAVPFVDYVEGMMGGGSYSWPAGYLTRPKSKDQEFVSPSGSRYPKWEEYAKWGIGHEYRVPLWELVFHDCIISTWYWGDSNDFLLTAAPEVTPKKDAFNILYGTIPMMWAGRSGSWPAAKDVFLTTYRNTCKLHEAIAGTEMLTHEFVTKDRAVQRTRFSDGTEVIVNFGERPYSARIGGKSYLLPQNGFAAKGPKIEQSLAVSRGRPVTIIRAGSYHYDDSRR
jgi:hypothetical protein